MATISILRSGVAGIEPTSPMSNGALPLSYAPRISTSFMKAKTCLRGVSSTNPAIGRSTSSSMDSTIDVTVGRPLKRSVWPHASTPATNAIMISTRRNGSRSRRRARMCRPNAPSCRTPPRRSCVSARLTASTTSSGPRPSCKTGSSSARTRERTASDPRAGAPGAGRSSRRVRPDHRSQPQASAWASCRRLTSPTPSRSPGGVRGTGSATRRGWRVRRTHSAWGSTRGRGTAGRPSRSPRRRRTRPA